MQDVCRGAGSLYRLIPEGEMTCAAPAILQDTVRGRGGLPWL